MAHLQIRGKRMSGKKVPLVLGKTVDLEVWGPINALASPSHEYQVISSDPDRVELAAGSLNTRANLRLYKATAKTFGTATVMIPEGDLEIDFVDVQVLPNPSNVPFASWYAEVLPGIMRAWISFQTHNLADELAKTTNDAAVKALNAELELLHDAQEQLRRFR